MVFPGRGMGFTEFLRALARRYQDDEVSNVAGAVTFFGVLALFPFLLFLVALAGLFIDPREADALIQQLSKVAPGDVSRILGSQIHSLSQSSSTSLLTMSVLFAVFSASSGVVALIQALNRAYGVEEKRPFWKVRLVALGATLSAAALSLLAILLALGFPAIASAVGHPLGTLILWLRMPVAGVVMMFVWALLYYFLPDTEQAFKLITPGSVVGVVVWVLASWGFSVYVSHFGNYQATYGALGGIIVMLLWMWISSQVVLIGAEINAILEGRSPKGKRVEAQSLANRGLGEEASGALPRPHHIPEKTPRPPSPPPSISANPDRRPGVGLWLALGVALLTGWRLTR